VHRALRGAVLVLDGSGEGHELIGTPAAAWIALDEPGDPTQIAARLAQAGLEVDEPGAGALTEGLELLVQRGLVVEEAPPSPDGVR
jgi:hypothetical protein